MIDYFVQKQFQQHFSYIAVAGAAIHASLVFLLSTMPHNSLSKLLAVLSQQSAVGE